MTETKKTKKTKQEWLTEAFEPGTRIVCPICSKGVKVTAKGVLARHGHKFVGSGRYGTICVSTGTSTPKDAYGAQRDHS